MHRLLVLVWSIEMAVEDHATENSPRLYDYVSTVYTF